MLLSNTKKFIFIHIYKTAGTSVRELFNDDARLIDRVVYSYSWSRKIIGLSNRIMKLSDNGNKHITGYHKHDKAMVVKNKMGSKKYDQFYSFTFVRNPYDWMASLYFFIRQSNTHRLNKLANSLSFEEFTESYLELNPSRQVDFVTDHGGQIIVNKIEKFETLQKDIAEIVNHLDLSVSTLKHKNLSNSKKKHYSSYYTSSTERMVQEYFEKDFKAFNYSHQL